MAQVEGTGTVSTDPAKWWVVALLGAISIAAGVLALAYPDITLLVLGLIVGINLVLIGAVWIGLATTEQQSEGGRVLRFIVGFLAILAGLVCLVRPGAGVIIVGNPDIGLTTLALLAGIAFIVRGTVELMAGFYMRSLTR